MEHFDAVIVGSGFGGSVMAYRLADAGLSVCVLERGRPYPPGSFPRTPYEFRNNLWDPSEGGYGLYDVWSFRRGMAAVVSSALGGGSLIYANVLIRKDEKWFVKEDPQNGTYERWPVTRAELDPHYDVVEPILNLQKYPLDIEPYSKTPRTLAFKAAADQLSASDPDLSWFLPPLAVTFHNEGALPVPGEFIKEAYPNLHHRQRQTCRLCSECYIGCNYGSKNTLDYNFLSLAVLKGAAIRTLSEVRHFRPLPGGGYEIEYVVHDAQQSGQPKDTKTFPTQKITSKYLVLSAGTLGSTYLLMKNRTEFPELSPALGSRFSGNGDFLGVALKCMEAGPDGRAVPKVLNATFGPAITSTVRMRDTTEGGRGPGLYVQDAGYPAFFDWLAELGDAPSFIHRAAKYVVHRLMAWHSRNPHTEIGEELKDLLGLSEISAGSMVLLGMGRDRPAGRMSLLPADASGQQFLDVDFPTEESKDYLERVQDVQRRLASALGGEYRENPVTQVLNRLITVHPLGGCPMGENSAVGVVNPYGEVFGYPGFFIADGSVMPGPVGPNPSLTIAALANRSSEALLSARRGASVRP